MAEWSKALDSSSSIYGCVGSNPTACKGPKGPAQRRVALAQKGRKARHKDAWRRHKHKHKHKHKKRLLTAILTNYFCYPKEDCTLYNQQKQRVRTASSKILFLSPWTQHKTSVTKHASMAEWFKAADLRPAINDAWVRTPLLAT